MLSVRIPDKLENRLAQLANETNRSKSYYVQRALEEFLEDQEDYLIALARLEEKGPNISLADAKKELGLEDA